MSEEQKPAQKKMTMIIVCWLVGWAGVHRFMMGYTGLGVLYLLTAGVCGIMPLIDLIRLFMVTLKMADGRDLIE